MMQSQIHGLDQPQSDAFSNPNTDNAMPAAMRTAPRQSMLSCRGSERIPARTVRTSATMATGRLIQKIDRHVHWVRNPPAMGPIAVSPPLSPKKIASARPRSASGNDDTTTARAAGIIYAADNPWSTRNVMIHASATRPLGVNPHRAEDTAKPTTPMITTRRAPRTSASRPPRANPAASAKM